MRYTSIETGTRIGSYEVRSLIGRGGMGVVYEACAADGTPVALKVLLPEHLGDKHALRRFQDEAVAGLIVRHRNVARTLDRGETSDGIPFLVMERVCGESLETRLRRDGAPSLRRAVSIVRQVLAGLGALHDAGVVHGDVKSDNILLETQDDGDDLARLIDFGLAHVQLSPADAHRPDPDDRMISGTPEYMAPEVAAGHGSTTASDLYAVGIILYELITGSTPFAGGTPTEVIDRQLSDRVVPPSLRCTVVPAILERVVLRALDKVPARRFPSAPAFASALAVTAPVIADASRARPTARFSPDGLTLDWRREVA